MKQVVLYLQAKLPGREADDSPPSTVEVKNDESETPSPPASFHAVHKDNFTFK
jgi:hypothetical protein